MSIPAIILAAGASSRMGFPKALLPVKNKTLLDDQIARLQKAGCSPIIVVVGKDAKKILSFMVSLSNHGQVRPSTSSGRTKIKFIINHRWHLGQFSSIKAGLRALPTIKDGCLILPVDVPFVPIKLIKKILSKSHSAFENVSPWNGKSKGHPLWISRKIIKTILKTKTATGRLDKILEAETNIAFVNTKSKKPFLNINKMNEWRAIMFVKNS